MQAHERKVKDIFQYSTILRVPFYQRQYVWGEKEWDRFATDMETLVDIKAKHFLGPITFKVDPISKQEAAWGVTDKFMVVDGQQRLTTLSLYLKAVMKGMVDSRVKNVFKMNFYLQDGQETPILFHCLDDRAAYQEVMCDNSLLPYENSNIVKAYQYFLKRLEGKTPNELRAIWIEANTYLTFVEIILDRDDNDQQIFDSFNSIGVDLTIDELMKNFLYEAEEEEAYLCNWRPIFDEKSERQFWNTSDAAKKQASTDDNKTISNFFFYYVRIKMWEYMHQPGFDRKAFVQKSQIFFTCRAFVELFKEDKQTLANDIIEYAKLYRKYFDKANHKKRLPKTAGIERIACIAMEKDTTIIPYVLYVLRNVPSLEERNKIFGFLETYVIRQMICNPGANKMATEFYSEQLIPKRIDTYDKLYEYVMALDSTKTQHMPTDAEVAQNASSVVFTEATAKLVYYLQETKQNYDSNTGGYDYFCAEPIIPKVTSESLKNYPPLADPDKEAARRAKISSIGNFLLLSKPRNSVNPDQEAKEHDKAKKELKTAAKDPFAIKQKTLIKYIDKVVCSDWFKKTMKWDESDIDTRNENFAKVVVPKLWPIKTPANITTSC